MEHVIDAKKRRLGRLASEIAHILQGKHLPSYHPRFVGAELVIVKNVRKLDMAPKKTSQKIYYRHAGRLGHLKERRLKDVFEKNPAWVLRHAVRSMLPKNRLRSKRMKQLMIEE